MYQKVDIENEINLIEVELEEHYAQYPPTKKILKDFEIALETDNPELISFSQDILKKVREITKEDKGVFLDKAESIYSSLSQAHFQFFIFKTVIKYSSR